MGVIKIDTKKTLKQKLLCKLAVSDSVLTVDELATYINRSGRTVRNYLNELADQLEEEHKIELVRKPSVGIYLDATDEQKRGLRDSFKFETIRKYSALYRERYILQTLLTNQTTYTIQLFSEELYCSKGTIFSDLIEVESWLATRGLHLKRKQNQGLWVEGTEQNYRRALMDLAQQYNNFKEIEDCESESDLLDFRLDEMNFRRIKELFGNLDLLAIQGVIQDAEKKLNYCFTDQAFMNLIIHIAITIKRIKSGKEIVLSEEFLNDLKVEYEYSVAQWVVEQLEEIFHIQFPKDEISYISLHMLGAKIQEDFDMKNYDLLLDSQNQEYVNLAIEIIQLASEILNTDLTRDELLLTSLALHLRTTVVRLKYGLKLRNPVLSTIKNEYTSIFGAAWACNSIFERNFGLCINEHEVGYIAMHLAAGVSRKTNTYKTVVVCSSGIGTSQLVARKLQKVFTELEITAIVPVNYLTEDLMNESDIIISTVKFPTKSKKIIFVGSLLDESDQYKITSHLNTIDLECNKVITTSEKQEYMLEKVIDKELCFIEKEKMDFIEIIQKYGSILIEKAYVKEGFIESIVEREEKGSTHVGKGIAIPHSNEEYVNESKICVVKLENPILWQDNTIKLIFILALKIDNINGTKLFFNGFYTILENDELIDRTMKAKDSLEIYQLLT